MPIVREERLLPLPITLPITLTLTLTLTLTPTLAPNPNPDSNLTLTLTRYAKSMGLYGERVGAVNFVCSHEDEAAALMSQVKQRVVRP